MAITLFAGIPGKGKTAYATYDAVKKYKKDNWLLVKLLQKRKEDINLIYSNYPILLDKRKNVYSHQVRFKDLNMNNQFPSGSMIVLDEAQRYQDSRDFKNFPKNVGTFLQHHRHGSIQSIIFVSQHPRRLDNKIRDLSEVFRKYRIFIKIPLIPVIFTYYTNYYEFEDYGRYNHIDKEHRTYEYDNHFKLLWTWHTFSRYDSKYFRVIFDKLPMIVNELWTSKQIAESEIDTLL
jgi:hypothetical protein